MLLVIGLASAAALAVIAYNAYKDSRPEMAVMTTRKAQQLAAVVLAFSRAVEGVVEALALGLRPEPATARGRLIEGWEDFE